MESAAGDHPFFNAYNPQASGAREAERQDPPQSPHQDGQPAPQHHDDTPPPPGAEGPDGPPPPPPPPSGFRHGHGGPPHHRHEGGPPGCGWGGRRHGGGPHCGRRGQRGPGFPFGGPHRFGQEGFGGFGGYGGPQGLDLSSIAQFFGQHLGLNPDGEGEASKGKNEKADTTGGKDFTPPCDVFDTEDAFIVHVSLPGAKKEDVGINWNADISELSIAGVIYRPGDEDFLKTLAMDERQVGVFERKVRLGSRARPAMVEIDEISAKMEDGVLLVKVPKLDSEYVDVKKVEIE